MSLIPNHLNGPPALDAQVLVLNRVYSAIRIIDARRAFTLLAKQLAAVVSLEDGAYRHYDFHSWADIAELQATRPRRAVRATPEPKALQQRRGNRRSADVSAGAERRGNRLSLIHI